LVSHVFWDMKSSDLKSKAELIFVHLPFSLLHAYLVFLLVLSAFKAFGVDKAEHPAGIITQILVSIALVTLALTRMRYAFHSDKGNIASAVVIALDLAGVFACQNKPDTIHWDAFVSFLVILVVVLKAIYFTVKGIGH
ncbi:hypothetical protein BY996DRAFT_4593784, partial [Phakopsora pachyrhizi]